MDPAQQWHLMHDPAFAFSEASAMQKAVLFPRPDGTNAVIYECPGCGHTHSVPTDRWHFSGDVMKPSLSPSVRHFYVRPNGEEVTTCHYFIREGRIEFCNDSRHSLAGQTVDLPDIDPAEYAA